MTPSLVVVLVNALSQARAALPDAWAATRCKVPPEVLALVDDAIREGEAALKGEGIAITDYSIDASGHIVFTLIGSHVVFSATSESELSQIADKEWIREQLAKITEHIRVMEALLTALMEDKG